MKAPRNYFWFPRFQGSLVKHCPPLTLSPGMSLKCGFSPACVPTCPLAREAGLTSFPFFSVLISVHLSSGMWELPCFEVPFYAYLIGNFFLWRDLLSQPACCQ